MTESFTLGGDPAAIRSSAGRWTSFGSSATSASSDLKGLDSGDFMGDEGTTFRTRINSDMQPHLDTTGSAWSSIGGALKKFAGELEDLQQRMDTLRTRAGHQQTAINQASTTLASAKSADTAHTRQQFMATLTLKPGDKLPPSTYTSNAGSASSALGTAQSDYHATAAAAHQVRVDHDNAVKACCTTIDTAKGTRFQAPPGFLDKVKSKASAAWDATKGAVSWAAKHIGPILKVVAMIAGVLALIPGLNVIMGPIALVAGAAALTLDVLNKLMNGEGSWTQIGLDTLALVPGIKPLTTVGRLGKVAAVNQVAGWAGRELGTAKAALRVAKNAGTGVKSAKRAVRAAKVANKTALTQQAAVVAKYAKIDKVWGRVGLATSAGGTALTTVQSYKNTGSWKQAAFDGGVSALGTAVPGMGNKLAAAQGLVVDGVATGTQTYSLITDPEARKDPMAWLNVGASGAKTVIGGVNGYKYRNEGTHPNGTHRDAYEVPNYWG